MPKKSFIDSIRVNDPCNENWDEMTGNDRVRFCSHCSKNVNDISKLTRKHALRLVRESNGQLCVRYVQHPKTKAPIFADRLYQISRRAPLMAAGVMTASLSLATMTYAQGKLETLPAPNPNVSRLLEPNECDSAKKDTGPDTSIAEPEIAINSNRVVLQTIQLLPLETSQVAIMGMVAFPEKVEYKNPLTIAIQDEDIDELRNLIAAGNDVNGREDDKSTPLFAAVENGNIEMLRLLLDFGAKINARNKEKMTPLMMLDEDATKELVELLIINGAKVDLVSKDGGTALIRAGGKANAAVLKALIDAGADVNAVDKQGQTPLMNAAENDNLENVRALLLAGADVNLKNGEGDTAWHLTAESEIEELLVSFGAVVEDEPADEPQ